MGETPLIRCAHNGHFATVKFLVDNGADVNALDVVSLGLPGSKGQQMGAENTAGLPS
jgi:hypothetical protein